MIYQYGAYKSAMSEAGLAIAREDITAPGTGLLIGVKERWTLNGWLQGTGPDDLWRQCRQLEQAFSFNYLPAWLFTNNGVDWMRYLPGISVFGGTRVVSGPSYLHDGSSDAEFSTYRRYQVVIEGSYALIGSVLATPTLVWQETITTHGTGGPTFVFRRPLKGKPQKQATSDMTTVRMIQRGHAVGLTAYPVPPLPVLPLAEHQDQREIEMGNPDRFGLNFANYPISWTYVMEDLPFEPFAPPLFKGP